MPRLQVKDIRNDVLWAEEQVTRAARIYGHESQEYQDALLKLSRIWSVLRMSRSSAEFFKEVTQ